MQEIKTNPMQANKALAIPSPTWLQNFPYISQIFIHWSSGWPSFAKAADCAAAATPATHKYATACSYMQNKVINNATYTTSYMN